MDKILSFPCIFHMVTGYYCPGCGGTRALKYLIKGDIVNSFIYNPTVLYLVIIGTVFLVRLIRVKVYGESIQKALFPMWVYYFLIFIIFANFIIKNLLLYYGINILT